MRLFGWVRQTRFDWHLYKQMTQIDNKTDCLGSVSAATETTSKNINKMLSQSHSNAIWPQRIEVAAEYCQTMHKHTDTFDQHIVITHRHTDIRHPFMVTTHKIYLFRKYSCINYMHECTLVRVHIQRDRGARSRHLKSHRHEKIVVFIFKHVLT